MGGVGEPPKALSGNPLALPGVVRKDEAVYPLNIVPLPPNHPSRPFSARRQSGWVRALAPLVVALHLFLAVAVPVLDAQAAHADRVVVHIEDAQQSDCPASHTTEDCQLCQLLTSTRFGASTALAPLPPALQASPRPEDGTRQGQPAPAIAGGGSRAPPRA